jgi:hypothetical protein
MSRGKPWQVHLSTHMPHGSIPSHTPQQVQSYSTTLVWHMAVSHWCNSAEYRPNMWHMIFINTCHINTDQYYNRQLTEQLTRWLYQIVPSQDIGSKQATNQFAAKPHGPRLSYLQMEPICQVYECRVHTSKHVPSLHTIIVINLNQMKIEAHTWLMCRFPLTVPCLECWLTCARHIRPSFIPASSPSLSFSSTRERWRCHEWEVLLHSSLV